jgi:hypothetical protein
VLRLNRVEAGAALSPVPTKIESEDRRINVDRRSRYQGRQRCRLSFARAARHASL